MRTPSLAHVINLDFRPDNLRYAPDGRLLVAGVEPIVGGRLWLGAPSGDRAAYLPLPSALRRGER